MAFISQFPSIISVPKLKPNKNSIAKMAKIRKNHERSKVVISYLAMEVMLWTEIIFFIYNLKIYNLLFQ